MSRNPWAGYWARGGAGCIPHGAGGAAAMLEAEWRGFAKGLPQRARVLDLATGDGVVLRHLRAARPDLRLTGVDSAPALPAAPKGVELRAGVAIEALPFEGAGFAAITSQFGVEYGALGAAAAEAARVLAPCGRLRFLVHHRASALVAHNAARARALRWALAESGQLTKGKALARARGAMALPTPPGFAAAVEMARARFPDQPVAAEFLSGLRQILEIGAARPPAETLNLLADLEARGEDELARLDALAAAARDEAGAAAIAQALKAEGLSAEAPEVVGDPDGTPLAWRIDAAKAG